MSENWQITSAGRRLPAGRPPPTEASVAYAQRLRRAWAGFLHRQAVLPGNPELWQRLLGRPVSDNGTLRQAGRRPPARHLPPEGANVDYAPGIRPRPRCGSSRSSGRSSSCARPNELPRATVLSLEDIDGARLVPSEVLHDAREGFLPIRQALVQETRRGILWLPLPYREVVILADIGGFSYREVARIMNVPAGTVMSRLCRGRRMLRSYLAERPSRPESAR